MMLLNKTHMNIINPEARLTPDTPHDLCPVLSEVDSLCAELLSSGCSGFDPSPAVTRAITNVVCTLVFSATYCHGDAELQEVLQYNDGIVQTIARGGLVDIYPWMKVCPAVSSCCRDELLRNTLLVRTSFFVCVFQVFPNKTLSKLKDCITVRDRLLSKKLEEHKVTHQQPSNVSTMS